MNHNLTSQELDILVDAVAEWERELADRDRFDLELLEKAERRERRKEYERTRRQRRDRATAISAKLIALRDSLAADKFLNDTDKP